MFAFIWMVLVGFIVGLLARFLKPGNDKMGFILTTAVGIFGSILAGFVGREMGFYYEYEAAGFFASVLGAIVLLALLQFLRGKRRA